MEYHFAMESDSRNIGDFSYGEPSRMDRVDQFIIPQHSTLVHPRSQTVAMEVANPLDLSSAIAHELQRTNSQPAWQARNHQLVENQSSHEETHFQTQYGSLLSYHTENAGGSTRFLPQYIPCFDEAVAPSLQQLPTTLDYSTDSESFGSAHTGFYSRSSNGLTLHPTQQVFGTSRLQTTRSCSPWIERMMQVDVTPTPGPSLCNSSSLKLAQRAVGDVSSIASQTVELKSCYSSDMQQRSERSMLPESTRVEISAELCTDDEEMETRPVDQKRKKRMLSNRASAQRSRQRRQERLEQLEVLTAKLRVEKSILQKRLSAAIQEGKKHEERNKNLLKKVERLSKELEGSKPKILMAAFDECTSSQQTTCASSCEMVGGRVSVDPNLMRDGNRNDGASTPSMSAGSPGWPSGSCPTETQRGMDIVSNGNKGEVSPICRSLSACRVGKKRSFSESEAAPASFGVSHSTSIGNHMGSDSGSGRYLTSQPNRPRLTPAPTGFGGELTSFPEPSHVCNAFGLDLTLNDDSSMDGLEADRWLEFAECFK